MTDEQMLQHLEKHRYQSTSVTETLLTQGVANSIFENIVKNSLAKETSASFQFALKNGGIYQNNALLGSSNLYNIMRKITPKILHSDSTFKILGLGKVELNKFSAGELNPDKKGYLNTLSKNISENLPRWDVESDIVSTGVGVQNSGYRSFFNKLADDGFELKKSLSPEINWTKKQLDMQSDIKTRKFVSEVGNNYEQIYSSDQSLKKYIKETITDPFDKEYGKLFEKVQEIEKKHNITSSTTEKEVMEILKNYDDVDYEKTRQMYQTLGKNQEKIEKINEEFKDYLFVTENKPGAWTASNLSSEMNEHLMKRYKSMVDGIDFDIYNNTQELPKQLKKTVEFIEDYGKLENSFSQFGKISGGAFNKAYKDRVSYYTKQLKIKNIKRYAMENEISLSKAFSVWHKQANESIETMITQELKNSIGSFSDDIGRHFASKTGFQSFMGNDFTRLITGIQSGITGFLWQLPAMVVSTVASINQENSIQNFISSYLYNPNYSEMYQNSGVDKSMQVAGNIHMSNLQDTQNIVIKHNTAERYLNDLDPMNIELDYTQKSFDLNPRNE